MTALLLPPDEVARVRTLKGPAYVLAIMIILDRYHPGWAFTPKDVSLIAGMDERTVTKQLQDLSTLNRVILSASGYVLTEGGRAMFLPAGANEALALSPDPDNRQALSPEPPTGQALEAQALQIIDAVSVTEPEMISKSPAHNLCALEEEVNLTVFQKETSSTTYFNAKLAQSLNERLVFGKSYLLFDESVTRFQASLEKVLAVFAHVYMLKDKSGFRYPARVAFAMLRDNRTPRDEYALTPWKWFPDSYLEALGVVRYKCNLCNHELFKTSKELSAHMASHPEPEEPVEPEEQLGQGSEPDPEPEGVIVDESINCPFRSSRHTPVTAWAAVLDQIRGEMHAAPFETWVKGSEVIHFRNGTMTISVRNQSTKEWLESRIKSTAGRLLIGITGQSVEVEFVVQVN